MSKSFLWLMAGSWIAICSPGVGKQPTLPPDDPPPREWHHEFNEQVQRKLAEDRARGQETDPKGFARFLRTLGHSRADGRAPLPQPVLLALEKFNSDRDSDRKAANREIDAHLQRDPLLFAPLRAYWERLVVNDEKKFRLENLLEKYHPTVSWQNLKVRLVEAIKKASPTRQAAAVADRLLNALTPEEAEGLQAMEKELDESQGKLQEIFDAFEQARSENEKKGSIAEGRALVQKRNTLLETQINLYRALAVRTGFTCKDRGKSGYRDADPHLGDEVKGFGVDTTRALHLTDKETGMEFDFEIRIDGLFEVARTERDGPRKLRYRIPVKNVLPPNPRLPIPSDDAMLWELTPLVFGVSLLGSLSDPDYTMLVDNWFMGGYSTVLTGPPEKIGIIDRFLAKNFPKHAKDIENAVLPPAFQEVEVGVPSTRRDFPELPADRPRERPRPEVSFGVTDEKGEIP